MGYRLSLYYLNCKLKSLILKSDVIKSFYLKIAHFTHLSYISLPLTEN